MYHYQNILGRIKHREKPTNFPISFIELSITSLMEYWGKTWPHETVTPKMHLLETHAVDFIRKWKVGFGFYREQGIIMDNPSVSYSFYCIFWRN